MMLVIFLVLLCSLSLASGANILAMLVIPTHSHSMVFMPIIESLAERGHNITLYTTILPKQEVKNVKVVQTHFKIFQASISAGNVAEKNGITNLALFPFIHFSIPIPRLEDFFESKEMQDLIHDTTSNYDLVLLETFPIHEIFVTMGHKFNAPVINLDTHLPMILGSYMTGTPHTYSYVPSDWLPLTDDMSFLGRTMNTLYSLLELSIIHLHYLPALERLKEKHFAGAPPLSEMLRNTSLTISIACSTILYPRAVHQNVIEVYTQIPKVLEDLPKDLQDFMDGAEHGVIYFTMGSFFQPSDLSPRHIDVFVSTFRRLKQRVLWKWMGDQIPGLPPNVKLMKWFPQTSVLNHSRCRLFITHGGYNSYFEAMYFGVPVIGIPLLGDQPHNVNAAVTKGVGLSLGYDSLTKEALFSSIQQILQNSSFKENAVRLSQIIHDSPATMDNAMFWVEYVLKHGAQHLRPSSVDLYWYQYILLDVVAFLGGLCFLFIALIKIIINILLKKIKAN